MPHVDALQIRMESHFWSLLFWGGERIADTCKVGMGAGAER